MRVLVADDDPASWYFLARVLDEAGHTPLWARDALQAAVLAELHRPDLVLLDIASPSGDGMSALARLKDGPLTASIPVIVLSALRDDDREMQALRYGALVFLHKPIDAAHLLEVLARAQSPDFSS